MSFHKLFTLAILYIVIKSETKAITPKSQFQIVRRKTIFCFPSHILQLIFFTCNEQSPGC